MKQKHKRLYIALGGGLCLIAAVAIVLTIFKDNLVFFFSPSDVKDRYAEGKVISPDAKIKIGGLIKADSIKKDEKSLLIEFVLTDNANDINVKFEGLEPPMFRDEQGIVAEGYLQDKSNFKATRLLTKHDENYMPPEIMDALKKSEHWKNGQE